MSFSAFGGFPTSRALDDLVASVSGYGSYSKYIDCNSALALIGLLLFLDVLRDLVDDVPDRRRRDLNDFWTGTPPELASFVYEGGVEDMYSSLNESLILLNHRGDHKNLEERLCEVNLELRKRYGLAGRLIGTLISNVIGRLQTSNEAELVSVLKASKTGRTRKKCEITHPNEIQ